MNLYNRLVERVARTKGGAWFFTRIATRIDRHLVRWTKGRISSGIGTRFNQSTVLVATTGAKTGLERTTPLLATPDGDRLVVVASYGGNPKHPAWYGNLKKTPRCRALFGGAWRDYAAREVEGSERDKLWQLAVANYPGYADYQTRVERRIPVMLLEPT